MSNLTTEIEPLLANYGVTALLASISDYCWNNKNCSEVRPIKCSCTDLLCHSSYELNCLIKILLSNIKGEPDVFVEEIQSILPTVQSRDDDVLEYISHASNQYVSEKLRDKKAC